MNTCGAGGSTPGSKEAELRSVQSRPHARRPPSQISRHHGQAPFAPSITISVSVIASAFAVAAAIELAYTLFTPGPDEAVEPLMLGLSSGILFLITENAKSGLSPAIQFSAVLLGAIALGVLFVIRNRFTRDDSE